MATWQYTIHLFPAEYIKASTKINMETIDNFPGWKGVKLSKLSAMLNKTFGAEHVLYGARSFGKSEESCAHLQYDESTDLVTEISFRLDLRRSTKSELESVLLLASNLKALVVTQDFKIISPTDIEMMKQAVSESDAAKFIKDPVGYLENLKSPKD